MRSLPRPLFLLTLCLLSCDSADPAVKEPAPPPYTALRDVAPFPVGVAMQARHTSSQNHAELVGRVFNSITAEYEMKMVPLSTGRGSYAWPAVEALVEFADQHDMQIHGHALVWHQITPAWLENFGGTDEEFEEAVEEYITDVVTRYKGIVRSWDVVNEAFEDGSGALRNSVFRRRMGDNYIERLFAYARAADPEALLFYNDYGTLWDANKRRAQLTLVDRLKVAPAGIDGVGLQTHITYTFPTLGNITSVMDQIVERGLLVHLSELDVRVNPDGDLQALTDQRSEEQKQRVRSVVHAFMALPAENRYAITLWGIRDPESWLIDFWGNPEWPLLFDEDFNPKPAYHGFLEAVQ